MIQNRLQASHHCPTARRPLRRYWGKDEKPEIDLISVFAPGYDQCVLCSNWMVHNIRPFLPSPTSLSNSAGGPLISRYVWVTQIVFGSLAFPVACTMTTQSYTPPFLRPLLCTLLLPPSNPPPPQRERCETSPSSIMCIHTHLTCAKNKPLLVAIWAGGGVKTRCDWWWEDDREVWWEDEGEEVKEKVLKLLTAFCSVAKMGRSLRLSSS